MKRNILPGLILAMLVATIAQAQTYTQRLGNSQVKPADASRANEKPILTWGADLVTFYGNGASTKPQSGSIFQSSGVKCDIVIGDNFDDQVKQYLSGRPYIRGTSRMMGAASETLNQDPSTKPVWVLQLSYSGGDHIVGASEIKTINDLKGKRIALQYPIGPHLGLIDDACKAGGFSIKDVTIVPCDVLSGPGGPTEKLRNGEADAACVITPDMFALCTSLDGTGTGAEGTMKGAHVVVSTATMSKSIADSYWVRSDYFNSAEGRAEVEKFVTAWLKAGESFIKERDAYDKGQKTPIYGKAMDYAMDFYNKAAGEDIFPNAEEVHGMVLDARLARIPGNELFAQTGNPVGQDAKMKAGLNLAVTLGLSTKQYGWDQAKFDYKKISEAAGVAYVAPKLATNRIKVAEIDFTEIDDDVVLSFPIYFDVGQTTFDPVKYQADFDRVFENQALFGNGVLLFKGNSDTLLALKNFFLAARAKGLITGSGGAYKFNGRPLDLTNTPAVIQAIQATNLSGQRDSKGSPIDDPRDTVASAQSLSETRAINVKASLIIADLRRLAAMGTVNQSVVQEAEKAMKVNNVQLIFKLGEENSNIDWSAFQPRGYGISEPVYPRPRSREEAAKNRRVEVVIISVPAETISDDDFNFDQ